MKKKYYLLLLFSIVFAACGDNKEYIVPSEINNVTVESKNGAILLKWDIPASAEFMYIQIEYTNPRTNEKFTQLASSFTQEKEIEELLKKDGEYTFEIRTVSKDGTKSPNAQTVKCTCLPRLPETTYGEAKQVLLREKNVSTNAQEPKEGPIKNLVDGIKDDSKNYFHTPWSFSMPMPHWVDIILDEGQELESFYIITTPRVNSHGGTPKKFDVMVSSDGITWGTLFQEEAAIQGKVYTTPIVTSNNPVRYIRYNVRARTNSGTEKFDYFNLAELELYQVKTTIYDPENED